MNRLLAVTLAVTAWCQSSLGATAAQCTVEPLARYALSGAGECESTEIAPVCSADGPRILHMTERLATGPDAFIHVQAEAPPAALEVRLDGTVIKPIYVDEAALGGLYPVPPLRCHATVAVRASGAAQDSDCRRLEVVPPHFDDSALASGVAVLHNGEDDEAEEFPVSAGVAFADIDGDGDMDLFLPNFGLPSLLYRNDGSDASGTPRYTDITGAAGLDGLFRVTSAVFADIDNDGDADLYVGRDGTDRLFVNQRVPAGSARFVDRSRELGLQQPDPGGTALHRTNTASFGDYDGDGRLDLYVGTHVTHLNVTEYLHQDRLMWNTGAGFEDVTALLDGASSATRVASFAAAWSDLDGDGDQDLVVSADQDIYADMLLARPGALWRNDGPAREGADGREWLFSDLSYDSGFALFPDAKQQGLNAMGMALADLDGDGLPEIAMSNIGPNVLLRRRAAAEGRGLVFDDIAAGAGVQRTWLPWQPRTPGSRRRAAWQDMSITWGVQFLDGDNDGDQDLFFAGGSPPADRHTNPMFGRRPVPNAYFDNVTAADGILRFEEQTFAVGLADPIAGMSSATADVNGDGWLDLAVAAYRGRFRLYLNRGAALKPEHGALMVKLRGTRSSSDALGARVTLTTDDGRRQTCEYVQQPGSGSGSEVGCFFGTGTARATRVAIRWPSGLDTAYAVAGNNLRVTCVEP